MAERKVSLRLPAVCNKLVLKTPDFSQLTQTRSLPASPEPLLSINRPFTKVRKGLTFAKRYSPKLMVQELVPVLEFKIMHRRKGKTSSLDWMPTLSPCETGSPLVTSGQRLTLHTKKGLGKPATPWAKTLRLG